MTPTTATPPPRASALARFGPLTVVLVAIGLVAGLASTGREGRTARTGPSSSTSAPTTANEDLPITWAEAKKAGTTAKYQWGEKCDPATGRVKVPSNYAPPCLVARPGVAGGATSPGVTADTITVVAYELPDDDISAALQGQLDPVAQRVETRTNLIRMLEDRFELWGRKIKIVDMKGTGSDETSARADAVKVATEIKAFASLGGPSQQNAYADELASRHVLCIGCGLSVPDSRFQENAPYMWGNFQTPEQFLVNIGDYLITRLNKKPARFAGDPAMRKRTRTFGNVNFETDPPVFGKVSEDADKRSRALGLVPAARLTYQLVISELPEQARTIVAKLKEAKVTTVVFLGDPLMPMYLTKAATDQNYFPEWVITGTVLSDTTTFGRLYDQRQWAHAFGLSSLPVRIPEAQGEARRLYRWYYGVEAPGPKTAQVIYEPLRILMIGLHMAGPHLTPETYRDGMFAYPPSGHAPTNPQISFGNHGFHAAPDYLAVDDMTEVWWDPKAPGHDEQGKKGVGMMRYADGGKRYLPGKMPRTDPHVFIEKGSVVQLAGIPKADQSPSYPSPAKKPGG